MAADVAAAEAFRRGLGWHLLLQVISVVHFAVALYEPAIKDAATFALPVHVAMLVLRLVVHRWDDRDSARRTFTSAILGCCITPVAAAAAAGRGAARPSVAIRSDVCRCIACNRAASLSG